MSTLEDNTAPQWVKHAFGKEIQATAAWDTYLIKQRLPLLRQGTTEKKECEGEWQQGMRRGKLKLRNRCQSGAPVWKWWLMGHSSLCGSALIIDLPSHVVIIWSLWSGSWSYIIIIIKSGSLSVCEHWRASLKNNVPCVIGDHPPVF